MVSEEPSENTFLAARQSAEHGLSNTSPWPQQGTVVWMVTAGATPGTPQSKQLKAGKQDAPYTHWGGFLWLLLPWKYFFCWPALNNTSLFGYNALLVRVRLKSRTHYQLWGFPSSFPGPMGWFQQEDEEKKSGGREGKKTVLPNCSQLRPSSSNPAARSCRQLP